MKNIVILISGRGSNMEALLAAVARGELPVRVAAVISNRPEAKGLETAAAQGVPTAVVDHKAYAGREAFDRALGDEIERHRPALVLLAGFMRVLGNAFVERFAGRMLNIHPSLLPSFPGLHTHAAALAAGVRIHGCTVHFVTPSLDCGPIVVQAAVPVRADDDEGTLAARVLVQEHIVYADAARWFLDGRLSVAEGRVRLAAARDAADVLRVPQG